ncbi:MAG TPA: hypothetical protein VGS19_09190 [Streptosporangiaceae bacterium]|nr:hypothetical protein [Streptosporangiaceae bacterium]
MFWIGSNGTAVVRADAVPGNDVAEAAEYCPAAAITVRRLLADR